MPSTINKIVLDSCPLICMNTYGSGTNSMNGFRFLIASLTTSLLVASLSGCQSNTPKPPVEMHNVKGQNEPCWIKQPECNNSDGKFVYFVGEADKTYGAYGRPPRAAFRSAQSDAEFQYTKYLGTRVSGDVSASTSVNNSRSTSNEKVLTEEFVRGVIDSLKKQDEYFVSYNSDISGEPQWNVFVLYRIDSSLIKQHREQVKKLLTDSRPKKQPQLLVAKKSAKPVINTPVPQIESNSWKLVRVASYGAEASKNNDQVTLKYSGKGSGNPKVYANRFFPINVLSKQLAVELSIFDNQRLGLPELKVSLIRKNKTLSSIVFTGDEYYEASGTYPTEIKKLNFYGKNKILLPLAQLFNRINSEPLATDKIEVRAQISPPNSIRCSQCEIKIYSLKLI